MTIVAVDGQTYSTEALHYAVEHATHDTSATPFVVEQNGWVSTYDVDYHDGLRYPHMERIPGVADMLLEIMSPHRGR